jgi:hypothetical protein
MSVVTRLRRFGFGPSLSPTLTATVFQRREQAIKETETVHESMEVTEPAAKPHTENGRLADRIPKKIDPEPGEWTESYPHWIRSFF